MNDAKELVLAAARRYWDIRNSGDLSDRRSDAHNDLIDALDAAGIRYEDREHAAQIGLLIIIRGNTDFEVCSDCGALLHREFGEVAEIAGSIRCKDCDARIRRQLEQQALSEMFTRMTASRHDKRLRAPVTP